MLDVLLLVLAALVVLGTALPFLRVDVWWVRVLDFPRLQLALVGAAALAGRALLGLPASGLERTAWALVAVAVVYQTLRILPYSPLWRKQVQDALGEPSAPRLRLMISNVLMENRDAAALVALVRERRPDLVVLAEPDAWWRGAVSPLFDLYPHRLDACQDDTYGLLLLSRLPLLDAEIRRLVEPHLPSFRAHVTLGQERVRLFFVHPEPPAPQESTDTTDRDGELLVVAREVAAAPLVPTLVAGDLNDVAWSRSTRLFQKTSRLLDPRRGRGLFASFHADYPFLRWPLDHVFHSDHFTLVRLERLRSIGSDHFPMWIELERTPGAEHAQEAPDADAGERREAEAKIARAA